MHVHSLRAVSRHNALEHLVEKNTRCNICCCPLLDLQSRSLTHSAETYMSCAPSTMTPPLVARMHDLYRTATPPKSQSASQSSHSTRHVRLCMSLSQVPRQPRMARQAPHDVAETSVRLGWCLSRAATTLKSICHTELHSAPARIFQTMHSVMHAGPGVRAVATQASTRRRR